MSNNTWRVNVRKKLLAESYDEGFGPFRFSVYKIIAAYLHKIENNNQLQSQFPVLDDELLADTIGEYFVHNNIKYTVEKFRLIHERIMETFGHAHPVDFPCYNIICDYVHQIHGIKNWERQFPELDDDTLSDIISDYVFDDDDDYCFDQLC